MDNPPLRALIARGSAPAEPGAKVAAFVTPVWLRMVKRGINNP